MPLGEIERLLAEDCRDKARARGGQAVAKKSPRVILMPSDLVSNRPGGPPWWKTAPTLIHVVVATGQVLVKRWPVQEGAQRGVPD